LAIRAQPATDGRKAYQKAVEGTFGGDADNAQLVKLCGDGPGQGKTPRP